MIKSLSNAREIWVMHFLSRPQLGLHATEEVEGLALSIVSSSVKAGGAP